jgi:Holliday junction resolvase RusA-like endonuclease
MTDLLTLIFTIGRKPVSVNATYKRGKLIAGRRGFYRSSEATLFRSAAKDAAFAAARLVSWPKPESVSAVEVEIVVHNTRHDADAPCKAILDALEGIVYANDRCVRSVKASKAKDGGIARVDVLVRLVADAA